VISDPLRVTVRGLRVTWVRPHMLFAEHWQLEERGRARSSSSRCPPALRLGKKAS